MVCESAVPMFLSRVLGEIGLPVVGDTGLPGEVDLFSGDRGRESGARGEQLSDGVAGGILARNTGETLGEHVGDRTS